MYEIQQLAGKESGYKWGLPIRTVLSSFHSCSKFVAVVRLIMKEVTIQI